MKILTDENLLNGNPHLYGHNMTVLDVVSDCFYGGVDSFLSCNPRLSMSDLSETLKYCESRICDLYGSHCGGCYLRLSQDNLKNMDDFINRFSEVRFVDSDEIVKGAGLGVIVMPGNKNTLPQIWKGVKGWEMADFLLKVLSKK